MGNNIEVEINELMEKIAIKKAQMLPPFLTEETSPEKIQKIAGEILELSKECEKKLELAKKINKQKELTLKETLAKKYDLNTYTREELHNLLSTAKDEIEAWVKCNKEIEEKENFIVSKKKNIKDKQNERDYVGLRVIWLAITVLWLPVIRMINTKNGLSEFYNDFLLLPTNLKFFVGGITFLPIFFAIRGLLRVPKKRLARKKSIEIFQVNLQKAKANLSILKEKQEAIKNNVQAIYYIPDDYCSSFALSKMLKYLQNREATTWERCTDLFSKKNNEIRKTPAPNRQFGASGGVVSWDTSQDFGSSAPDRALPIPPPDAKLLKRYVPYAQCGAIGKRERQRKRQEVEIKEWSKIFYR